MKKGFFFLLIIFVIISCSNSHSDEVVDVEISEWLVDEQYISGVFNPFPLGQNPEFDDVSNFNLSDNERVGVMRFGEEIRVYPYPHTFATEIINDEHQGQKFAFTYCPITKSAVAFKRNMNFRASGYLFKDNMVPWDEETETEWSQMLIRGIRGEKINQRLETLPLIETRWKTIKTYFPNAKVMKPIATSSGRYSGTSTSNTSNKANEPDQGEFVYGILDEDDNVNAFRYEDFNETSRFDITLRSDNIVVVGSENAQIINAFKIGDFNDYQTLNGEFPHVLQDSNGVKYNILGIGTNGQTLDAPDYAYVAAWWAWEDFFTNFNFR